LCRRSFPVALLDEGADALVVVRAGEGAATEGGVGGGEIVATGTPEQIVKNQKSYTGKYLKPYLNGKNGAS